jgi:hypothetical protein
MVPDVSKKRAAFEEFFTNLEPFKMIAKRSFETSGKSYPAMQGQNLYKSGTFFHDSALL